jgi:hypothetical protein
MISTDGTSGVTVGGQAVAGSSAEVAITAKHAYRFEARDPQGNLKWVVEEDNIIPTVGLNEILDKFYKGSAYTAAHYVGLTDGTPTVNAADTMASHAGWAEVTAYDEAARQAATWGSVSAGSVSNSASKGGIHHQRQQHYHRGRLPGNGRHQGRHVRCAGVCRGVQRRRQDTGRRRHPERDCHRDDGERLTPCLPSPRTPMPSWITRWTGQNGCHRGTPSPPAPGYPATPPCWSSTPTRSRRRRQRCGCPAARCGVSTP